MITQRSTMTSYIQERYKDIDPDVSKHLLNCIMAEIAAFKATQAFL